MKRLSLLLLLLVGCSQPKPPRETAKPAPVVAKLLTVHTNTYTPATSPPPHMHYSLIWSNENPMSLFWVVEHKRALGGTWAAYANGIISPFTNIFVPISQTNSMEFFRAGWTK